MTNFTAEISTMIYPTEVESRVKELILSLCGEGCEIREERFSSHYGYSFRVLTCTLSGEPAESLLRRIICSLDRFDLISLLENLDSHVEGRNLYIRLSKQDLALGRFKLYRGDPGGYLRLRFLLRISGSDRIREEMMRVGEGCTQT